MKLRIPPILIMFIFGVLMYLLVKFLPVGYFDFFGRHWGYKIMLGLAVLVFLASFYKFKMAKTTVDPLSPQKASSLVTTGIFKYTRNPVFRNVVAFIGFCNKIG